ncbi:MAG TPA: DeoR/GlpR family DNA-binding transcription regulator [bacterium]|nr:DeoR/GlpR family DNA-binding transcription regulator [bacterium]HNT65871.1 DeoR/GlpR family DNA-binding transcription regulator [bacterium]
MNKTARSRYILQVLEKNGEIEIDEIVGKCSISAITARRDLEELARQGLLIRTHGGAMRDDSVHQLFSFGRRIDHKREQKTAISRFAAGLVDDNETLLLDCGTTVFYLCPFLAKKKNLTVISNSLSVAAELARYGQIKVILIGGEILPERRATYGPTALAQIQTYHADKAFIGTNGLSLASGLTSYDENEAQIVLAMAQAAEAVYLLCDSAKIEKNSLFRFAPITLPDAIVTDAELKADVIRLYKQNQINLLIA